MAGTCGASQKETEEITAKKTGYFHVPFCISCVYLKREQASVHEHEAYMQTMVILHLYKQTKSQKNKINFRLTEFRRADINTEKNMTET